MPLRIKYCYSVAGLIAVYLPPIFIGAGMLMLMDASINVAMEPFRALVGDKLPDSQRSIGFSIQTFLIGVGAVSGSFMPYILSQYMGVSKIAVAGTIPNNIIYSFYAGAVILLVTIIYTVVTTKEYSPETMAKFSIETEIIEEPKGLASILTDFSNMPLTMRQLGLVQFFRGLPSFLCGFLPAPQLPNTFTK